MDTKLLALFGLKYNPFAPAVPTDALLLTPKTENFCWRIEHAHLREGGFALITGDPGTGKSVALRLLASRLARLRDVAVGSITHPQSTLADFYREMGEVFGVALKPHNRWAGFKALRQCWQAYIESTLSRPLLLIDEAQEMNTAVLCELRLLSSMHFDSKIILSVVLAGDARLTDRFRHDDLLPLGSRIRTRLTLDYATADETAGLSQTPPHLRRQRQTPHPGTRRHTRRSRRGQLPHSDHAGRRAPHRRRSARTLPTR